MGSVTEALALLRDRSEKASDAWQYRELLAAAEALAARWPETKEMESALLLSSMAFIQMAEPEKGMEKFLAYADAIGARVTREAIAKEGRSPAAAKAAGESATAGIILQEAARLYREGDKFMARGYCDVVIARYRGSEKAWVAQKLVGDLLRSARKPEQAIECYRAVIREAPVGSTAWSMAWGSLPTALANAGRADEAVQAFLDYANATPCRESKANAYYDAGAMLALRGKRHYARAARMYETAMEQYPGTPGAKVARRALEALRKKIEQEPADF